MRVYYVGESRSRSLTVATALGVDGEAWDAVSEHIQDWRWVMEDEFNVPTGRTLRGADLLSPKGSLPRGLRRRLTTLEEGLDIMMTGLRVLESAGWRQGGIGVINVCRRNSPFRQHRRRDRAAARQRLLELVNASLAADRRYGHIIEDETERDGLPALAAGPVHRDPILAACLYAGDEGSGRDIRLDTVACVQPYHRAGDDELLQMACLVSYALLQQEDPTAMSEALNFHLAFGILKGVLDRRACPQDHQGVDRL
ncbi:MAG: hypothetical protein F4X66_17730 [Chloroflexi bacterium]|nr:hypothetical protein [Chloroflexota bacterium]